MMIIANIPIPIPTNFLFNFLLGWGFFASICSTNFSSILVSFGVCFIPDWRSRNSLSYLSKPVSFLSSLIVLDSSFGGSEGGAGDGGGEDGGGDDVETSITFFS